MSQSATEVAEAEVAVPGRTVLPGKVVIDERHLQPDPELWARTTLNELFKRLGRKEAIPSTDDRFELTIHLYKALVYAKYLGTVYVNPMFTVSAERPSPAFYRAKARCQKTWLKWLKSWLYGKPLRMEMKAEVPCHSGLSGQQRKIARSFFRKLAYTGVLIVEGKHVPKDVVGPSRVKQDIQGKTSGRLTATKLLNRGRCLCDCACGRRVVVRISHLRNGNTSSCGCLRKELDDILQARKEERALSKTAGTQVLIDMMEKTKRQDSRRRSQEELKVRRATRASTKVGINSPAGTESTQEKQAAITQSGLQVCVSLLRSEEPNRTQPAELAGPGGTTTIAAHKEVTPTLKSKQETTTEVGSLKLNQNHCSENGSLKLNQNHYSENGSLKQKSEDEIIKQNQSQVSEIGKGSLCFGTTFFVHTPLGGTKTVMTGK